MNNVAAVIVTYNRLEMLKECISKLLEQDYVCDILIVNNASTDNTEEYILENFSSNSRVLYKNTGANLGGAGGFNYGIRWAVELKYEFIWVMDDDCMPTKGALKEFIQYDSLNKGKYGFLSSKVLWKDGTICKMNIQRKTMYRNVKDFNSKAVPICMASFVSFFVPSYVIKEVGLPIKEFFIWTDDWEFTRRISLKYKSYLINDSVVIHKSASNIGANIVSTSLDRLERFKYLYRNDVYLYKREGVKGYIYELVRLTVHSLKVLLLAPNKLVRLKILFSSTIEGFSFNPSIEMIN